MLARFKKIMAGIALVGALMVPGQAKAAEWFTPFSKGDLALEATYLVAHVIDLGQTLDIVQRADEGYWEINPVLGEHPSTSRVYAYMAASAAGHVLVAWALPKGWRTGFQLGTLGIKLGLICHNQSIGLGLNFSF